MKIVYAALLSFLFFCCEFSKDAVSNTQETKQEEDTVVIGKAIEYFIPGGKTCVQYQMDDSEQNLFRLFLLKGSSKEIIISDSNFYPGSTPAINRWYYSYSDTEVQLIRLHYSPGQGGMGGEKNIVFSTPITSLKLPKKSETLKWESLDYDNKDTIKYTASWKTMTVNNTPQQVLRVTEWKSYAPGAYVVFYYAKGLGLYKKAGEDMQGSEVFPTTIKSYCK